MDYAISFVAGAAVTGAGAYLFWRKRKRNEEPLPTSLFKDEASWEEFQKEQLL